MNFIKNLFNRLFRKNHYPATGGSGKQYAFTAGGIKYYQLSDFNNLPPMRAMKTLVFFEEMRMKCTVEYLKLHTEAMQNLLSQNKIDVFEIKKLNDQMKQRLDLAVDMELVYKIGSIVFFDETEDISDYDDTYNAKKVAHWKKFHADDFFLFQPIRELVPALKATDENFLTYIRVVQAMNGIHLENLLFNLPSEKKKKLKTPFFSSAEKTTRLN